MSQNPGAMVVGYVSGALAGFTAIFVMLYVVSTIVTSPLAPAPGDPLYPAQQSVIESTAMSAKLLAPGVLGAGLLIIGLLSLVGSGGGRR